MVDALLEFDEEHKPNSRSVSPYYAPYGSPDYSPTSSGGYSPLNSPVLSVLLAQEEETVAVESENQIQIDIGGKGVVCAGNLMGSI
eukprot:TRINITY_DN154_c0_g1_i1.p1 TRINITY_DN154_c0_g1~~TRINITY_DN154_c0_g1_i1.p1  ORF type:complete len:97 (-),score=17.54 TRINITY_DN154_c0_g1_i1:140-397(-)